MGLAWLRTAVSLLLVGLALPGCWVSGHPGPLAAGVLLVLASVLGLAYGTGLFRRLALLIEQGDVAGLDKSRVMVAVSVVLALTIVAALALLLLW